MVKVLVADDSLFMRKILARILDKMKYKDIVEAENGDEALEKFKSEKPDLVLLDIVMKEKYGIDVLREIMALDSKAKVIIVSAVGQESIVKEATHLGAKEFITKPFKESEVVDTIHKVLGYEEK